MAVPCRVVCRYGSEGSDCGEAEAYKVLDLAAIDELAEEVLETASEISSRCILIDDFFIQDGRGQQQEEEEEEEERAGGGLGVGAWLVGGGPGGGEGWGPGGRGPG